MDSSHDTDAKFPIYVSGNHAREILTCNRDNFKLPEGAVLLSEKEREYAEYKDRFNSHLYFESAKATRFGSPLLWSPCLPSTHTILSQNFGAFPVGTVCVADSQVSGKGRSGNVWESPYGCLMFSFTLQVDNGRMLPFLQYVVSIAVIDAINHLSLIKGLPNLPLKIKWPNDIYANNVKLGGVLCTSTYREKKFDVVAGIGLNVENRKPTTCLNALLEQLGCSVSPYKKEELLRTFFDKFEDLFGVFITEGFKPLECSYYEKWLHSGQEVILEERENDSTMKISLVIKGLSPTGYLLATDDQMEAYELHPDGNSFDFLKGLVRTKLQS
ncbi:hypothetical protein KP509_13G050300 [Ceratopteris richardii]|uniref:BPL/LPL catalytic domain-containing protein n=1 Tax=Ceratopteris richardii TaxID=49495 RepID=A0A8T2TDH0_CERRI|nr:hypothetical protein KP509_13G050300 [Ceratopteris richardii]